MCVIFLLSIGLNTTVIFSLSISITVCIYYRAKACMKDQDRATGVAMMGAPSVLIERLVSERSSLSAVEAMQNIYHIGNYDSNGTLNETGNVNSLVLYDIECQCQRYLVVSQIVKKYMK